MGRPLVWVTIAFAGGILLAERRPLDPALLLPIAGVAYAAWVVWLTVRPTTSRRMRGWHALLPIIPVVAIAVALGHLTASLDPVRREVAEATRWEGRRVDLEGGVTSPVEIRDGRQRVTLRVARLEGKRLRQTFTVIASLPPSPPLRYGDVVAARGIIALPPEGGNPGEPSPRAALRRRGIAALLRVASYRGVTVLRRDRGDPLLAAALRLRDRLVAPLLTLPPPYGGVLAGLLFGAQAGASQEMEQVFLRAGLLHVLVVSGAQVGLLAGSTLALLGAMHARPALRVSVGAAVVLLFGTMVGWGAAVGRAAIMALVGLTALLVGRETDPPSTLALAALLWLALFPSSLFGLGFQLSFAATWGLVALSPVLTPALRPRWFAQVVGATTGAQVAVLPLLAAVFQRVSLAAFPANLIVLPIVAVLVPAGFLLSVTALFLPGVAAFLAPAFLPPVWAIVALARIFAAAPGAEVWLPPVAWWQVVAAYALLLSLPEIRRRLAGAGRAGLKWAGAAAIGAALIAVFSGGGLPDGRGWRQLMVVVLDVGQGDAILLRGPSGRTMLVDGGGEVEIPGRGRPGADDPADAPGRPDIGTRRVIPALRHLGVRRLDVVLLSHAHEDHVGGLPAVLQNFSVELVLDPGVPHRSPSYVRFLDLVRQYRLFYAPARRGQRVDLGGGAAVQVVWPPPEEGREKPEDAVNARSVVARVGFGRIGVLLTGDIEAQTEEALVRREAGLESTVLKVAHHGSKTSTTPGFLDAVRPTVAVISVGRGNLFGHPHAQTLRALERRGVRVYRTDRDGAVILRTGGADVSVQTMRATVPAEAP